jgi:hypothetical protein
MRGYDPRGDLRLIRLGLVVVIILRQSRDALAVVVPPSDRRFIQLSSPATRELPEAFSDLLARVTPEQERRGPLDTGHRNP